MVQGFWSSLFFVVQNNDNGAELGQAQLKLGLEFIFIFSRFGLISFDGLI